jgi:transposase
VTVTSDHSVNAHVQAGAMDNTIDPEPEVPERARGPRRYSASYKAQILEEYQGLDKAGKGALLRREGLYTSLISEWRKQRDRGALQALAKPAGRQPADPRDQQVARLRRENQRLAGELDKARKVIESRESSRRCWSSSPPTA